MINRNEFQISFNDDIKEHVAYAFNTIYQYHYGKKQLPENNEIARQNHGIQHVTRAAFYSLAFINLYRLFNNPYAQQLTDEDIKLIQLAMIYHDAERLGEGKDLWDKESGAKLYHYLTAILKVNPEKAKLLAEAVANKDSNAFDSDKKNYYSLIDKNGKLSWKKEPPRERNIYQKIIHDADCLDIQRARKQFNQNYLDFYRDQINNNDAFDIMTFLVMETNRLIEAQGDSVYEERRNNQIKKHYESADAYQAILHSISVENYPLLHTLCGQGLLDTHTDHLAPFRRKKIIFNTTENNNSTHNLMHFREQNKLIFRGLSAPTGESKKNEELLSTLEIRKAKRKADVPTPTKKMINNKPANLGKEGNDFRSACLIVDRAQVHSPVGYFIPAELSQIRLISDSDICSGVGKKKDWESKIIKNLYAFANIEEFNKSKIILPAIILIGYDHEMKMHILLEKNKPSECYDVNQNKSIAQYLENPDNILLKNAIIKWCLTGRNQILLNKLSSKIKVGNLSESISSKDHHNELLTLLTEPDYENAVPAFTQDVCLDFPFIHPYSRPLQAMHLKLEWERHYNKKTSIHQFSANWKEIREINYSVENLKEMWEVMTADYIQIELVKGSLTIFDMSIDEIKVNSMYGTKVITSMAKRNIPADIYYTDALINKITAIIANRKTLLIEKHIKSFISNVDDISIFSENTYPLLLQMSKIIKGNLSLDLSENLNLIKQSLAKKIIEEINKLHKIKHANQDLIDFSYQNRDIITKLVALIREFELDIPEMRVCLINMARQALFQVDTSSQLDHLIRFLDQHNIKTEIQDNYNNELKKIVNKLIKDKYEVHCILRAVYESKLVTFDPQSDEFILIQEKAKEYFEQLKITIQKAKKYNFELPSSDSSIGLSFYYAPDSTRSDVQYLITKYLAAAYLCNMPTEVQASQLGEIAKALIAKDYQFTIKDFAFYNAIAKISDFNVLGLAELSQQEYLQQLNDINVRLKCLNTSVISVAKINY